MRQKSMSTKSPAQKAVRGIRRKARKKYSAEVPLPVTLNDGLQNAPPLVGTMHVAGGQVKRSSGQLDFGGRNFPRCPWNI